jgi:hypothetical protein
VTENWVVFEGDLWAVQINDSVRLRVT